MNSGCKVTPNKSILAVTVVPSDILHLLSSAFHFVQLLQILANTNCRKCRRYVTGGWIED